MNSCSFQQLIQQNLSWFLSCLRGFIFKPTERKQFLLKNDARDSQNNPPYERLACFYVTTTGNFERCQLINFEAIFFWKTNTFFKNLDYRFLVESTKTEKVTFPYKIALPKNNAKTNRMGITKQTYRKEQSFASNYFILLIILLQYKSLL